MKFINPEDEGRILTVRKSMIPGHLYIGADWEGKYDHVGMGFSIKTAKQIREQITKVINELEAEK